MVNLVRYSLLPLKKIVFYASAWDLILSKYSFSLYIQNYKNITSKIVAYGLAMIQYGTRCRSVGIFVAYDGLQTFYLSAVWIGVQRPLFKTLLFISTDLPTQEVFEYPLKYA